MDKVYKDIRINYKDENYLNNRAILAPLHK